MDAIFRALKSKQFVLTFWFGLCLFPVIKSVIEGHGHIHNNYFVYKGNFFHLINQQNLFAYYPDQYFDAERPLRKLDIDLLIFALILTSLSPSDLFPRYIRKTFVEPYALKALPCFLIWLKIIYDTLFRNFYKKGLNLPLHTV